MRSSRLIGLVGSAALLVSFVPPFAPAVHAASGPSEVGEWSVPINVGVDGIHAALLRNGRVLLFAPPDEGPGSDAGVFDPVTEKTVDVSLRQPRDLFCSALTIGPDGRVTVVGGMEMLGPISTPLGSDELTFFDPATNRWTGGPSMARARYYATVVEQPDGTALVFTGSETGLALGTQREMEVYDPATDGWSTLPPSANVDATLYSKAFLLPDGRIFRAGPQQATAVFDPRSNSWTGMGTMRYGDRGGGAAVLLPGLSSVLTAGGAQGLRATSTAEIIDLSAPSPPWQPTGSMAKARSELNLVLLPDGTVLAVGGGSVGSFRRGAAKEAEVYDPATGTWRLMAAQQVKRTYHSTALLLADGRVLSAGDESTPQGETVELYSPPYLFRGPRPTIADAPAALAYGEAFTIATPDASEVTRVALIRPGAETHANNFDQRYVDLDFEAGSGIIEAHAPASPALAPPGYYMLFIVNEAGIPAVARFVALT